MRTVVLLYNPTFGKGRHRQTIERIAEAITTENCRVSLVATHGPRTAGQQAAMAAESADIVFAAGGDGTVHEAMQGLVHQPSVTLGIVPLGSANVLARHLQLPLDPVRAALQQVKRPTARIAVGLVTFTTPEGEASRYFAVLAGSGADGALVYRMLAGGKQRLGRSAYYLRAARLFLSSRFHDFSLKYTDGKTGEVRTVDAVSAMAIRVGDLGGLFSPLARGCKPDSDGLQMRAVLPPAWWTLPAWFAASWLRVERWNRSAHTLLVREFACGEGRNGPVQVQADGEWLGRTPMRVTLVPDALRVFVPPTSSLAR